MTDRSEAVAARLRAALERALVEWKVEDQPDKPRDVIEKWAGWFADRLLRSERLEREEAGLREALERIRALAAEKSNPNRHQLALIGDIALAALGAVPPQETPSPERDCLTNHEHDCECRDPKHPSHRHSFEHEHVVLHRHDHEHPTDGMVARRIENGAFATDRDALDRYWSRAEKDTSPPGPPDAPRRDYPEPMA